MPLPLTVATGRARLLPPVLIAGEHPAPPAGVTASFDFWRAGEPLPAAFGDGGFGHWRAGEPLPAAGEG